MGILPLWGRSWWCHPQGNLLVGVMLCKEVLVQKGWRASPSPSGSGAKELMR